MQGREETYLVETKTRGCLVHSLPCFFFTSFVFFPGLTNLVLGLFVFSLVLFVPSMLFFFLCFHVIFIGPMFSTCMFFGFLAFLFVFVRLVFSLFPSGFFARHLFSLHHFLVFSALLVCGLSLAFIRPENAIRLWLDNGMHCGGEG